MADSVTTELLQLNQRLLDSITQGDWKTYEELCDPTLTCFEPEAVGQLVEGLAFHQFYFELGGAKAPFLTTMASPAVAGNDLYLRTRNHLYRIGGKQEGGK